MRDIKSFERAMRLHGQPSSLSQRINAAVRDLNHDRPRPMLGGRVAPEVFVKDRISLPNRQVFMTKIDRTERELRNAATTRAETDSARRRAVESVLLGYRLMKTTGDVSHNSEVAERTK